LEQVLSAAGSDDLKRFLLDQAAGRFSEVAEDMRGYTLKHEALRRCFATDDEKDAYRRALVHLVGDKRVCLP
jgi:hypothetical protein